jgi:hypothetical protein
MLSSLILTIGLAMMDGSLGEMSSMTLETRCLFQSNSGYARLVAWLAIVIPEL